MKRIISGMVILLFSMLCAGFSEAAEFAEAGQEDASVAVTATEAATGTENHEVIGNDVVTGSNAAVPGNDVVADDNAAVVSENDLVADDNAAAGNDVAAVGSIAVKGNGIAAVNSPVMDNTPTASTAGSTGRKHSLLRVMMHSGAATEEQALVLAEKKAVAHVIQEFQERNTNKEYAVSVFTLAEEYEKFVIAANILTREIKFDGISLETRIDIDGDDLMSAMAEYEVN